MRAAWVVKAMRKALRLECPCCGPGPVGDVEPAGFRGLTWTKEELPGGGLRARLGCSICSCVLSVVVNPGNAPLVNRSVVKSARAALRRVCPCCGPLPSGNTERGMIWLTESLGGGALQLRLICDGCACGVSFAVCPGRVLLPEFPPTLGFSELRRCAALATAALKRLG